MVNEFYFIYFFKYGFNFTFSFSLNPCTQCRDWIKLCIAHNILFIFIFGGGLLELIMYITFNIFCDGSCCQQKTFMLKHDNKLFIVKPPTQFTDCNLMGTHRYFWCICLVHAFLLNLD